MIDLRSDTVTKPTQEMLHAMCAAPLGDDVLGDEPTVQKLEAKVAEMTGKDTAVFVPSGTMANQIAIWLHTHPGDGILVEENAHIFHYEAAGPAMIAGVKTRVGLVSSKGPGPAPEWSKRNTSGRKETLGLLPARSRISELGS